MTPEQRAAAEANERATGLEKELNELRQAQKTQAERAEHSKLVNGHRRPVREGAWRSAATSAPVRT